MKDLRKIKIHKKYIVKGYNHITIPIIKLEGTWLKKLGFIEGQMISIKQEQNKLTIIIEKE